MTILQPYELVKNAQNACGSPRECADAPHIITSIRQNKVRAAVIVLGIEVLAATPWWQLSRILARPADTQVFGIIILAATPQPRFSGTLNRAADTQVLGTKGWFSTMP
jgi:type IV secretory pathway VirB10-like protein